MMFYIAKPGLNWNAEIGRCTPLCPARLSARRDRPRQRHMICIAPSVIDAFSGINYSFVQRGRPVPSRGPIVELE